MKLTKKEKNSIIKTNIKMLRQDRFTQSEYSEKQAQRVNNLFKRRHEKF